MSNSNLEDKSKQGFFKRIKGEIRYIWKIGLEHYLLDLTGYLIDRKPMHDHGLTSKDNLIEHSKFY